MRRERPSSWPFDYNGLGLTVVEVSGDELRRGIMRRHLRRSKSWFYRLSLEPCTSRPSGSLVWNSMMNAKLESRANPNPCNTALRAGHAPHRNERPSRVISEGIHAGHYHRGHGCAGTQSQINSRGSRLREPDHPEQQTSQCRHANGKARAEAVRNRGATTNPPREQERGAEPAILPC